MTPDKLIQSGNSSNDAWSVGAALRPPLRHVNTGRSGKIRNRARGQWGGGGGVKWAASSNPVVSKRGWDFSESEDKAKTCDRSSRAADLDQNNENLLNRAVQQQTGLPVEGFWESGQECGLRDSHPGQVPALSPSSCGPWQVS